MLNRSLNSVMARLGIVAAALALLTLVAPVAFAATSVDYAENGMDAVVRFDATDQDGDAIVWSLGGDDKDLFTIAGGELRFKASPNYEDPKSASTGTRADKNVYNVTVQATGGSEPVTVTVTNVDEDGSVALDKPQPQVGRGLVATLTDQDGGQTDEVWQWARSSDGETFTDIESATTQSRSPVAADEGHYLRASVTYADMFGSGKTASAMTGNKVEARTLANAAPSFTGQDDRFDDPLTDNEVENEGTQVNRSVAENTDSGVNIGKPVSASDADNDVLIYTLGGTVVIDSLDTLATTLFSISSSTGQLKAKASLDFEGGTDNNPATNVYTVMVTATDPSGASASQDVMITLMDVNEAPKFDADSNTVGNQAPPTTLRVVENTTQLLDGTENLEGTAYDADDEDADADNPAEDNATLTLEGADAKYFEITDDGALTIVDNDTATEGVDESHTPNYETKSSYSITIVATSGAEDRLLRTKLGVTVNVVDAEDPGEVTLSQREPQAGRTVIATLSDPDGGVTVSRWTWALSDTALTAGQTCAANPGTFETVEPDVSSAAYTPKVADENKCLRATATYKDNIPGDALPEDQTDNDDDDTTPVNEDGIDVEAVSERPVQLSNPANAAPKFPDQDLTVEGDQSDETSRSVAENTEAGQPVGAPVVADDTDALMYSLGGADKDSFSVDNNGQIKTKAALDYEMNDTYTVVVVATDPSGATDSIMVTINVTDESDGAVIAGDTAVDYAENGTGAVAIYTATDQDGDAIVWSLSGADAVRFTIDGGELSFKASPDYEDPKSASTGTRADKNVYNVMVQATGGTRAVAVTVTNVDEDGSVSLDKPQPQAGRGLVATLADQDGGQTDEVWQWARSSDGETFTDIEGAMAQSRSPVAADEGHYLRASVTYADSFGSGKTASAVTGNKVEARTLANAAPSFTGQDDMFDDPEQDGIQNAGTQVNRSVAENTATGVNIGKPVSASDADNDVLIYTLGGTVQIGGAQVDVTTLFSISSSTGQLKTKASLDFEGTNPDDDIYTVMVTATDPSGAPMSQPVIITLMDVNEAPKFDTDSVTAGNQAPPTTLRVVENGTALLSGTTALSTTAYNADDEDVDAGNPAEDGATLTLEGADAKYFEITDDGALTIVDNDTATEGVDESHTPNYETKSSYSITIVATSGAEDRLLRTKLGVTVNVVDAEDTGTVTLSQREPQAGSTVIATLSDPDGGVTVSRWTWALSDTALTAGQTCAANPGTFETVEPDVSSAAYTPKVADENKCLRATATYKDNIPGDALPEDQTDNDDDDTTPVNEDGIDVEAVSERPVQLSDPANAAPKFLDQDLTIEGDQSDEASRSVAENTEAGQPVGAPVVADDTDALMYSLGGADKDSFSVDNNGQIKTKAALDYETKDMYMVALTAMDPSGATDSILVTISVIDGPDVAVITPITGPAPDPSGPDCTTAVGDGGAALKVDCQTLLNIMDDLVGDGTGLNWSAETPMSDWVGVAGTGSGRVTHIHLRGRGLAGEIPAGITALDALERLTLTDNDLTGEIPDLSGLDSIEWLVLGGNAFTGGIPASLGDLESLLQLWLHRNDGGFEGGIPAELGSLPNLRYLMLYGNDLTGEIPSELGNATNLKALYLHNNMLTGSIPAELGGMVDANGASARRVYLHNNMLSGDVPAELGNLTSLVALRLSGNSLSGCIPAAIFDAAVDADAAGLMACPDDGS